MQPQDAYEVHSAPASETSEAQREGTSLVIWEGMVLTGILVVVCYRFVLQLPFFFDDLPIMTWLGRHGWRDVFLSHEGNYYRPLAFAVYKWGTLFPVGFRQGILHAVNLLLHWINAIFVIEVTRLCEQGNRRALLAGALFSVFPFWSEVVPWITAMPHLLVTTLSLIAVYAALRAERDHKVRWWSASLLAMVLAPLAHESGVVCGVLVGGVISIRYGLRLKDRRTAVIALGCILNAAFVLVREIIPNVAGAGRLAGLIDLFPNSMYFLHGLLYPLAPLIGQLVQRYGWHDFTLLGIAAALWSLLLAWLIIRGHHRRWMAQNLWWWAVSALPAIISLRYASLFISARVYALSSVGITMLWTHILAGVSERIPVVRGRRLALILTTGMIVLQNMIYIFHERASYTLLNSVYQRVLSVSAEADYAPLGFVNLPAALEWQERVYPVIKDSVVFVPPYSNIAEFIAVNQETRAADTVMFGQVYPETDPIWVAQGPWLEWEQMRQFVIDHRTIWLTRYDGATQHILLDYVGRLTPDHDRPDTVPQAWFEGGPLLISASVQRVASDRWAIILEWYVTAPVNAEIFVHVRDGKGNVVAQADGASIGRMIPTWLWQPRDLVQDVRYVTIPAGTPGPCTVLVGFYTEESRLPAFMGENRSPDDAVPVATIVP